MTFISLTCLSCALPVSLSTKPSLLVLHRQFFSPPKMRGTMFPFDQIAVPMSSHRQKNVELHRIFSSLDCSEKLIDGEHTFSGPHVVESVWGGNLRAKAAYIQYICSYSVKFCNQEPLWKIKILGNLHSMQVMYTISGNLTCTYVCMYVFLLRVYCCIISCIENSVNAQKPCLYVGDYWRRMEAYIQYPW